MKIRLGVVPGPKPLPPEGVTVLANFENVAPLRLRPGVVTQEVTAEVPFERGNIEAYPFDEYGMRVRIDVVEGEVGAAARNDAKSVLFDATAVDSSVGFTVEATDHPDENDPLSVNINVTRTPPIIIWVCVMMAIYWLLAFSVMTVTALVVLSLREWESRHLAWLGAMLFAFATFRVAAPGSPPVGTFLDYAGFFWAELIVSMSLVALVIYYLLGLKDPPAPAPAATPPEPEEGSPEASPGEPPEEPSEEPKATPA